jgi:hypothetical protein
MAGAWPGTARTGNGTSVRVGRTDR